MSYTPHSPAEIRAMLERIGADSLDDLFASVPEALRARAGLKLPAALDERALLEHFGELAARNLNVRSTPSFLGAGVYHHFVPAAVDALASRGEFMTAYTPYQAEISQGTLQAIFEFQTLFCQLTGLDVSNASLYDGASAVAEAALLAMRTKRRNAIAISRGVHPRYRAVLATYTEGLGADVRVFELGSDGRSALEKIGEDVACVIVQSPNVLGALEDLGGIAEAAHAAGALAISVHAEPLALALMRPPGELGIDVACGEAQSFGVPVSFGGPAVGFMTARQSLVRQLPGRLIGETVDSTGQRAFVMTLTTREQHIRREKATSNICTNQGLCALRVTIFLSLLGRVGLRELAQANLSLAEYAKRELRAAGLELPHAAPTFNEFALRAPDLPARLARARAAGLQPGVRLAALDPALADDLLVCVTEMNTRAQIDRLVRELR